MWFSKMAKASILISEDEFCCSICLDLLKDPVTLGCGHSFCMSCITSSWDKQLEIYSCPHCRETFDKRPDLCKNNILADIVEKLRNTGPQHSDHLYAKSGDVECDLCTGVKFKAVKSCLVCLASFCEVHFQPHKDSSALMKHTVIEASAKLHTKICPQHGKLLEVFCRTDQTCICYLCTLDEHSNHDMVSALAERAEKQKQVVETQNNCTERILEREGVCLELKESLELLKYSAQVAVEDTEKMFQELIESLEKKCSEVTNQIRAQEEAEVNHTKEHLKQVEQEIVELKSKNEELKQLSQTPDNILYFQIFQSFYALGLPEAISRVNINMPHLIEDVKIFVHELKKQIESTKLYPDSSSRMKSQVTSHSFHFSEFPRSVCPPKQGSILSSMSATKSPNLSLIATHAKTPAESQATFSTRATAVRLSSTPATQSVFGLLSTTATQSQSVFGLPSTTATQSQSVFGLPSTTATQSQSVFGLPSTTATQSKSVFGLPSTTATQSKSVFGFPSTTATQSKSVFGFPSTTATQSKSVFGFPSTTATQSLSVFGFPSTTATQSQSVFGLPSTTATQSQSVFGLPSTTSTQSQSVFGLPSTTAT